MTQEKIFEKVRQITVDVAARSGRELNQTEITLESRFIEDLGFSSIAILEIVMAIEDAYDLDEIPEGDIEKVRLVKGAVQYLLNVLG